MLTGLFLSCFLAATVSQTVTPEPCDTPKQWEGSTWTIDHESGIMTSGKLSYDEVNQRERTGIATLNAKVKRTIDIIALFEEKKVYFFNPETEKCLVRNISREFTPAGVPKNATYQYSSTLGLGTNSLKTNTFALAFERHRHEWEDDDAQWPHRHHFHHIHTWYGSFTDDLCVPVSGSIYEGDVVDVTDERVVTLLDVHYSEITAGIASDKVFTPPSYCQENATKFDIDDMVRWYRFAFV